MVLLQKHYTQLEVLISTWKGADTSKRVGSQDRRKNWEVEGLGAVPSEVASRVKGRES